jgi:hypothetical protein
MSVICLDIQICLDLIYLGQEFYVLQNSYQNLNLNPIPFAENPKLKDECMVETLRPLL